MQVEGNIYRILFISILRYVEGDESVAIERREAVKTETDRAEG